MCVGNRFLLGPKDGGLVRVGRSDVALSGSGVKNGFRFRRVRIVGVGNARSNPAEIYTIFNPTLAASLNMPIRYVPPHLCSDLDSRQI